MIGIAGIPAFTGGIINPTSILPGKMKMWIDATTASMTTAGVDNPITAITDLSPNNLAITTTAPNQPIWTLGNPDATATRATFKSGSKPAIYIQTSGINQLNITTGAALTTGLSIFATVNFTSGTLTNSFASGYPTFNLCGSPSEYFGLGFNIQNAGDVAFTNYNYGSGIYNIVTTLTGGLNDGNTHTIACTLDFSNGTMKLYVDGVFQSSMIETGNLPYYTSWYFDVIGAFFSGGAGVFAGGMIAEMMQWDGVISAKNVSDLNTRAAILWSTTPIKGTAPTIVNPPTIFGANCIRSYEDAATGATWTDASGNYNTTSVSADPTLTTLSSGKVAYSFNGTQCLAMGANGAAPPATSAMTAWCIFNSSTVQTTTVILGQAYSSYAWLLGIGGGWPSSSPNNVSGAAAAVLSNGFPESTTSITTLLDGNNHSAIMTYDGTNVILYVDGQIYSNFSVAQTGTISNNSATDLPAIGAKCNWPGYLLSNGFTGLISSCGYANITASTYQLQQLNNWLNSRK